MRIFKQMCVDFKNDILFKDTLDYIEEVLEKLGITYDSMGFMIAGVPKLEKIAMKYPALIKYIYPQVLGAITSERIDENGNYGLRVDKSEHEILRELVKKTPRPYNFSAISIFLDNVRWFPEINTTPCLASWLSMNMPVESLEPFHHPQPYMSNCVVLNKLFNYGKKRNPVWITIEVGDEKGGIRDTSELEKSLSDLFEKPLRTKNFSPKYIFYFSDEEREHLDQLNKEFTVISNQTTNELEDLVNNAEGIQHIKEIQLCGFDDFTRVSGLSLAKALKKVLSVKEYLHTNHSGLSTVEKKNENNHLFTLTCELTPSDKILYVGISVSGHNFEHTLMSFDEICPNNQEELEYHIANAAVALKKAEAQLSEELLRLYGKSIVIRNSKSS